MNLSSDLETSQTFHGGGEGGWKTFPLGATCSIILWPARNGAKCTTTPRNFIFCRNRASRILAGVKNSRGYRESFSHRNFQRWIYHGHSRGTYLQELFPFFFSSTLSLLLLLLLPSLLLSFSSFRFFPFNFCSAYIRNVTSRTIADFYRGVSGDFVVRDVLRRCGEGTATWEFVRYFYSGCTSRLLEVTICFFSSIAFYFSIVEIWIYKGEDVFCSESMFGFRVFASRKLKIYMLYFRGISSGLDLQYWKFFSIRVKWIIEMK